MSIVGRARPEIRALRPYSSARAEATSAGVLLNANENPWPSRAHAGAALNRYPDPQPDELVTIMARFYRVGRDQLLLTRGSDEGIDLLVRAFCQAGKDTIIECTPCFGMYRIAAAIQGAKVLSVPLVAPAFEFDADALLRTVDNSCKIVFLTSPNNPTGNSIARQVLLDLIEALSRKVVVVVDEAYIEFSEQRSLAELVSESQNLVVLRTLSKAFALAGARCGALIAHQSVVELLRRILPPYPLPTPTVRAALGVFDTAGLHDTAKKIKQIVSMRDSMAKLLAALPIVSQVWPSDANFLLVRFDDAAQVLDATSEAGIVLRDFSRQPQLENCLRITIGTPDQNARLLALLGALG